MDHSNELWEMAGRVIWNVGAPPGEYDDTRAVVCELSEPRKGRYVEHTPLELDSRDIDEARSRGQLITAAPQLLNACIESRKRLQKPDCAFTSEEDDWFEALLTSAIAKAVRIK